MMIEKLYGKGEPRDTGEYVYRMEAGLIKVKYISNPCVDSQFDRPKDTVLSYRIFPKDLRNISELKYSQERYQRDSSGDSNSVVYRNSQDGVEIGVQVQQGTEYVADLVFTPSKKSIEKFKCGK